MKLLPSIELLSNILNINKNLVQMNPIFEKHYNSIGYLYGSCLQPSSPIEVRQQHKRINIYEFSYKNLKEWAKLKSVFDIIDWSEEPEQIFKKAEELRNEIN